jgi:predicted ester cyclase
MHRHAPQTLAQTRPTGRRFRVDEAYFFDFTGLRICRAWGVEDTYTRLRQLGLL